MIEVLTGLFDPTGFPPRKECGTGWTPALIWLHVTSDLFIWLAYLSIPLVLLYFTRRRDLPHPRLFVLFALFILACGTTHLVDALIFEYPIYRFAGVMKAVTAVVSWATVIALVPVVPRVVNAVAGAAAPGADTKLHRPLRSARTGRTREYVVAVLAALVAILARAALDPVLKEDHAFVVALVAVVYVSWQFGFGPGVTCLVVVSIGYACLFVYPRLAAAPATLGTPLAVGLFFFCGVACAALGESQRVAQRRARAALAVALARREELESEVARRRVVEAALRQRETELVTAQRETAEALARLNAFLDNAPMGIAFFDPELRYVRVNAYLAEANGKAVEEHTGRALPDVVPDFPPDVLAAYRRTAGPDGAPHAARFRRADRRPGRAGEMRAWQVTCFPVRGADGRNMGAGVIAQDVTDRVRAEDELRESEERFRSMADSAPALIWLSEPDGHRTYFNRPWLDFTGRTVEAEAGYGWAVNAHPDDRAGYLAAYADAVAARRPFELEYRLRRRDGTYRWVMARGTPRFTPAGDFAGFVGLCLDVTDRREAAEAVRQNEERYRVLTEAVPHVVWNADPAGAVTYLNRRWVEYTGLAPDRAGAWGWLDAVHPDDRDRVRAAWRAAVGTDGADRFGHEFRLLDGHTGKYRWFLSAAVPLRLADGGVDRWIGSMADIHDQKTAAEAIFESDAFRRSVFENSPDCVKIIDLDGRLLEMNEGGCRLMEVDDFEAVRGATWADLWPAASQETVREAVADARAGRVGRFQGFCPTAKGAPRYWDVSIAGVPGADGTPFRLVGVSRDVTEERRAEERVRESEEMFRQLAESIPQLAWMTDAEGAIFWYNQRWYDYTGTTLDEMKGWGWQAVHDPAELPRVLAKFKAHIASGEPWEDTFPLRGADGHFRWHLSRARPMRDGGGDIVRWFGTNTDISTQRDMEQSLRASEARFRTLTEAVPQIVWTADPGGAVTSFNKRWEEYTGARLGAPMQRGWDTGLIHAEDADRLRTRWQLAVAGGAGGFSEEFRLRRASDGAHRWMLSVAVPLRDGAGGVAEWVGTLTDIDDQKQQAQTLAQMVRRRTAELEGANTALTREVAERKAAEAQVRAVAAELERSNDELEKFAYVASHDLQEPLRKIQAFGDRLRTKCRDALPDAGKEYVDRMLAAAGRMRRLIDDLLTFARVTTNQRPFARLDLAKLVREVASDLEMRITQAGGAVVVGALPHVDADPTQMRQLFQNLIANAVKFHRPDVPPVVEVTAEFQHPVDGDAVPMCRFSVRDNGIGFDEKYRDRIFEVFQRLHGREEYEGTGVGLAICRKIVERHGGTITAHSRVGEGATFVVELPVRPDTPEATETDAAQDETDHDLDGR